MPTESDSPLERLNAAESSPMNSGVPGNRGTPDDASRFINTIFAPAIAIYQELEPIRAGDVSTVDPSFYQQTIGEAHRTLRQALKALTSAELNRMPAAAADAIREILAVVRQAERDCISFGDVCVFYSGQPALKTAGEAGWKAIKNQQTSEIDNLVTNLDAQRDATTKTEPTRPTDFDGRQRYLMDALRRLYEKGTDRIHLADLAGRLVVDCDVSEGEAEDLAKVNVRLFFEAGYLDYWQRPARGIAMYGAEPSWSEFRILRAIRSVAVADTGADDPDVAASLSYVRAREASGTASLADLPKAATLVKQSASPVDDPPASPPARKAKRSTQRGEGRAKLIGALTMHHEYASGGCVNSEPIGNNKLADLAGVSRSTASTFFNKEFNDGEPGGFDKYQVVCRNVTRLVMALKLLNEEYSPHHLFGGSPPGDRELEDEE